MARSTPDDDGEAHRLAHRSGAGGGRCRAAARGRFRTRSLRHYYVYRSARSERSVIATVYRLISSMILPVSSIEYGRRPAFRGRCAGGAPPAARARPGISRLPHSVMRDHLRLRCGSIMHALVSYA